MQVHQSENISLVEIRSKGEDRIGELVVPKRLLWRFELSSDPYLCT
jgi:hypothetical protein